MGLYRKQRVYGFEFVIVVAVFNKFWALFIDGMV